jgi:GH25 family lysozyme M1 (1,4-beta-N-acetylmuramidase)
MLKGCDISKWQGVVDFNALKNAIDFVVIRSSYGDGYTDIQFARNRDEARRLSIPLGFYHYSYPQYNTPEAEADWFCKVVGTPNEGEILCLDFEEQYSDPVGWSLRFLDRVSSLLSGYKPYIYLNLSIINTYDWSPVVGRGYKLWLARWDYNPNAQPPNTDWVTVTMRQWSNKEIFSGVTTGGVDANVFYGDKNMFLAYGYHIPVLNPPFEIEKLLKDGVIKDMYTFLCGGYSQDEIVWRVASNKSLVEIGEDICSGDGRFFDKWIKPKIPTVIPTPPVPEPPAHTSDCETTLTSVKTIVNSRWTWFGLTNSWKINLQKLKDLLK